MRVRRKGLDRLLVSLEARNGTAPAVTALIPPDGTSGSAVAMQSLLAEHYPEAAPLLERAVGSPTGGIVLWRQGEAQAVLPPFPVERDELVRSWDLTHLRELHSDKRTVGVVLVRLGRFAVGVFRDGGLISSKVDTRYVKGRHSAGGTSQSRFRRIREKQIAELYGKVCSIIAKQFRPFESELDHVLLGGERFTILGLRDSCEYLRELSPKILGRVLNVREPTLAALTDVAEVVWETRVLTMGAGP